MKSRKLIPLAALVTLIAGVFVMSKQSKSEPAPRLGVTAGDRLQPFTLSDQRDVEHSVNAHTRLLLFTDDKAVSKMVFEVLAQKEPTYLAEHQAAFVLDITAMPGLITRFIAKPRMRRHAFDFLLDSEGQATQNLPTRPGRLTVVYLDGLKVEKVAFAENAEALEGALATLGGTDATAEADAAKADTAKAGASEADAPKAAVGG